METKHPPDGIPCIDPATRWKDEDARIDGDDMRCICGSRWPCLTFLGMLGHAMRDNSE